MYRVKGSKLDQQNWINVIIHDIHLIIKVSYITDTSPEKLVGESYPMN